ncbi:hypothetical protein HMSSN139_18210 [Paenibacillus sp. HMSSN-139]|nr:hypothetical protein HMSSN139_18210 [Paenibacillus sp. HMSSN-139]
MKIYRAFGVCGLAGALIWGSVLPASAAIDSPEGRPLIETKDAAGSGEYEEWNGAAGEARSAIPPRCSRCRTDRCWYPIRTIIGFASFETIAQPFTPERNGIF